jgi:hypothetical protein
LLSAKVSPVDTSSADGLILLKEAKEHAPETSMNIHLIGHSSSNVEALREKTQKETPWPVLQPSYASTVSNEEVIDTRLDVDDGRGLLSQVTKAIIQMHLHRFCL